MKYQVDQYIPMAIDEAKVDWALIGESLNDQGKYEVIISSVAKAYAEDRLEFIESLGFNVIAEEPDPIAMVRALAIDDIQKAYLVLDMGEHSTDLAVVYGGAPRLVRTIPTGLQSLIRAAVQNLNVQEDQARQFILKFGLATDRLDGQVVRAIESTLDNFANEINKSVKFFQTKYPSIAVNSISLSGFGSVIPQLDSYVSTKASVQTMIANPWQHIQVATSDQQQLAPIAAEFATAIGLAQRRNLA